MYYVLLNKNPEIINTLDPPPPSTGILIQTKRIRDSKTHLKYKGQVTFTPLTLLCITVLFSWIPLFPQVCPMEKATTRQRSGRAMGTDIKGVKCHLLSLEKESN